MKTIFFFLIAGFSIQVSAFDIEMSDLSLMNNDKEAEIKSFHKKDIQDFKHLIYAPEASVISDIFYQSMFSYLNEKNVKCELSAIDLFKRNLVAKGFQADYSSVETYLKLLRSLHVIDNILHEKLALINRDIYELGKIEKDIVSGRLKEKRRRGLSRRQRSLKEYNDVESLYENFEYWPDETELCVYQEFNYIRDHVKNRKGEGELSRKKKLKSLKYLNELAYKEFLIDYGTYLKLEYMRDNDDYNDSYISLENYFEVIFKAKNKLITNDRLTQDAKTLEMTQSQFSTEAVSRYNKLTKRKDLYEKYSATEIMMLAQVLVKASRRMGVDPDVEASAPVIIQEFSFTNAMGERENYVERLTLDPQSQYNLARKRMRKDILDLQAMDQFYKRTIYYDEIVMAAYETGYLSFEDIEYAVQYDDLWNPEKSRFEKIKDFIFDVAGYATFFAPPPFNVLATLGLSITEGVIDSKNVRGEDNENISTFID
ncbi:MAG: hypothetical protein CME62_14830 [Halobacteriovoraceae bacterium]|nr:hypothetical protein [Halobacteriovoraceae bacterium]|tara:strand:- start:2028 stop:3479 length:1452 start_codon:yes stop_codon:yes gene_type:complete